jgi:hypothetical protein
MSHYLWNHIVKEAVFDIPEEETALAPTGDLLAHLLGRFPGI